ncbi:Serine/threonine protein phosphatase 2A regulatory subunit B beta isoform [Glycine max]|nr:Serine/threonine protein phosphatase 2A regulatory subunit B beta isoform [Glycine max]
MLLIFSSDGETFISANDLRINLWKLEISNQSFNIVDVKPANMEDMTGKLDKKNYALVYTLSVSGLVVQIRYCLSFGLVWLAQPHLDSILTSSRVGKDRWVEEVITLTEFHPTHCNTLAYSSSKGSIHLVDLEQSALCDSHAKLFENRMMRT